MSHTPCFLKKIDVGAIIRSTKLDKKAKLGAVNYILLEDVGKVHTQGSIFAHSVPDAVVKKAFLALTTA